MLDNVYIMFLKFKPFTNSKVWEFTDPDTLHKYNAKSRAELVQQIVGYREQNELPRIEYLDKVLENYLCRLPINSGSCVPRKDLSRSMMQTIKGGVALLINYLYESFVDQATADNRAAQCIACPNNIFPDMSGFDAGADLIAQASVGDRRSIHHKNLGNCEVCTCPLRAKVWYNGTVELDLKQIKEMEKVNCWQLKLLPKG